MFREENTLQQLQNYLPLPVLSSLFHSSGNGKRDVVDLGTADSGRPLDITVFLSLWLSRGQLSLQ